MAATARAEQILVTAHKEGRTVTLADFAELELGIEDALDRIAKA